MNPEHEKLKESISELHDQLESATNLDAEDRKLLVAAIEEIRTALLQGDTPGLLQGDTPGDDDSMIHRLGNVAQQFEDSHPNLSGAVGGLLDAIGRMGI